MRLASAAAAASPLEASSVTAPTRAFFRVAAGAELPVVVPDGGAHAQLWVPAGAVITHFLASLFASCLI